MHLAFVLNLGLIVFCRQFRFTSSLKHFVIRPEQEDYHEIFPTVEHTSESWINSYLSWIKTEAEPIKELRIRRDINSSPPAIFASSPESIEEIFSSSPGSQPEAETVSVDDSENEIESKIKDDDSTTSSDSTILESGVITESGTDEISLEATSILPGKIINAVNAHRINIPNPQLNSNNPEELIRRLINNRKIKHKIHPEREYGSSGGENIVYKEGKWGEDCLINGTKFPTLNLVPKNNQSISSETQKSDPSNDIRINKYYAVKRDRFYVQNAGTGMLSFKFEPEEATSQATIRGPGWDDEYILAKGNVFWSFDNNHGAQHSLEGQPFALEIQLVHYKKSSGSLEEAAKSDDKIVVSSLLYEATGDPNTHIESLARSVLSVGFPNKKWKQVHGPLDLKMLYPVDMTYFSYYGPYINQPCAKKVLWLVFQTPMPVSSSQLQKFRQLRKQDNLPNVMGTFLTLNASKGNDRLAEYTPRASLNIMRQEVISKGESIYYYNGRNAAFVFCFMMSLFYKIAI